MKSGYFNEVSGFFCVILFSILLSLKMEQIAKSQKIFEKNLKNV